MIRGVLAVSVSGRRERKGVQCSGFPESLSSRLAYAESLKIQRAKLSNLQLENFFSFQKNDMKIKKLAFSIASKLKSTTKIGRTDLKMKKIN